MNVEKIESLVFLVNKGFWILSPWIFLMLRLFGVYDFPYAIDSLIFISLLAGSTLTTFLVFKR